MKNMLSKFINGCAVAGIDYITLSLHPLMARRVAINLNQRVRSDRGGRGRGRGRGRGGNVANIGRNDIPNNIKPIETENNDELTTNNEESTSETPTNKRKFDEIDVEEIYDDEMMNLMGFKSFESTKNKHVKGTDCYAIKFNQKTEYRQYMNRDGGFNRELSPTRLDKKKIKMNLKKKQTKKSKKE